ncbi:MAG: ankyrin repeat domain-containing protein [Pseudomonadota bacterium]
MRRVLALLSSVVFGLGQTAWADPTADDIRAFHALVQTGGAAAVERALMTDPALATATDRFGFQAIHLLDDADFEEILSLLLRHGADINAQNESGIALLHIVIDPEFIPIVLDLGADLELKDVQGRTPLLVALTEPDNFEVVRALLQGGADPNARDTKGRTALNYARADGGDRAIATLLLNAGALD